MAIKSAVFIDGGYIENLLRDLNNLRVDFGRLAQRMIGPDRMFLRAYYYHCLPYQSAQPTEDESWRMQNKQRFFDALSHIPGFQVRLGYMVFRGYDDSGQPMFIQKGTDIQLVIDLLSLSFDQRIDQACILAGDGDFVPAVDKAKDLGIRVHVFCGDSPNSRYSQKLWMAADERTLLTQDYLIQCQLPG